MLDEFIRPLTLLHNHMVPVRIVNRFNKAAETLHGYRNIEVNVFFDGGQQHGACGRENSHLVLALVGEVQIVLEDFLEVRRRRHLVYKCSKGVFTWPPERDLEDETLNGANSMA